MIAPLVAAELRRSLLRVQTRRTFAVALGGLAALVVLHRAQGGPRTVAEVHELLDGIRVALPLGAALLGATATGGWVANGTAAMLAGWAPRRWHLAAVEVPVAGSVAAVVCTGVWLASALLVGVVAGGSTGAGAVGLIGDLLGPWRAVLTSVAVGAVLGAAVGLLCRAATGAVVVLLGGLLVVEPMARAALLTRLDGAVVWTQPIAAIASVSDVDLARLAGAPVPPVLVALVWAVATWVVAAAREVRRDVT